MERERFGVMYGHPNEVLGDDGTPEKLNFILGGPSGGKSLTREDALSLITRTLEKDNISLVLFEIVSSFKRDPAPPPIIETLAIDCKKNH